MGSIKIIIRLFSKAYVGFLNVKMAVQGKKNKWAVFAVKCYNPFEEKGHNKSVKLRNVNEWMCLVSKKCRNENENM